MTKIQPDIFDFRRLKFSREEWNYLAIRFCGDTDFLETCSGVQADYMIGGGPGVFYRVADCRGSLFGSGNLYWHVGRPLWVIYVAESADLFNEVVFCLQSHLFFLSQKELFDYSGWGWSLIENVGILRRPGPKFQL